MKLNNVNIPEHIAIILDGNGRWAKKKGFSRTEGHKAGVKNLETLINECKDLEVKYLTLYVFSTENWKRPTFEINNLMFLLNKYLIEKTDELVRENICLKVIGDISKMPEKTTKLIQNAVDKTKNNFKLILTLAINYGARNEIINGVKSVVKEVLNNKLNPSEINEEIFSKYMYTRDISDPDLLIRTSGEYRLSNFLLWQCAYTEFWFTDVLWPDFSKDDLYEAIKNYSKRSRRYGKVDNEE